MLKIGITGGIGSGKSTVCEIFKLLGIPVYNADMRARELMSTDPDLMNKIKTLIGKKAYDESGLLNRRHIASVVFQNKQILEKLNAVVHPAVFVDFESWANKNRSAPYVMKEAALTFESGSYKTLDATILIFAPEIIRLKRVISRDNVKEEDVLSRMRNQWTDDVKFPLADFVIFNDGERSLIRQVLEVHRMLLAT